MWHERQNYMKSSLYLVLILLLLGCSKHDVEPNNQERTHKLIDIITQDEISWQNEQIRVKTCNKIDNSLNEQDIRKNLLNNARTIAIEAVKVGLTAAFDNDTSCNQDIKGIEGCQKYVSQRVKSFSGGLLKHSSYKFSSSDNQVLCISLSAIYEEEAITPFMEHPKEVIVAHDEFSTTVTNPSILMSLARKAYEDGDFKKAYFYARKAADQGNAVAQIALGTLYREGTGVDQNSTEGFKWYEKAANQGDAIAQLIVGLMYQDGDGVSQDSKEAIKWFEKAANQGLDRALFYLGYMYSYDEHTPKNYHEAVKWFTLSAEKGLPIGQKFLAQMYCYDLPTQDLKQCYHWLNIAKKNGQDMKLVSEHLARCEETQTTFYKNGNPWVITPYHNCHKHGLEKVYFPSKELAMEKNYVNGEQNGLFKMYYKSGQLESVVEFINNKREGKEYRYYEDGTIKVEFIWKDDRWDGEQKYYYPNGKIKKIDYRKNGKKVN